MCCCVSSVPAPDVMISVSPNGTVYQGTVLDILCTVSVDSAVDTEVDINITWMRNLSNFMNSNITNTTKFTSTITFSPVDTTDSAMYTCTASVAPTASDSHDVIPSGENSHTVDISVESKSAQLVLSLSASSSSCRAHDTIGE